MGSSARQGEPGLCLASPSESNRAKKGYPSRLGVMQKLTQVLVVLVATRLLTTAHAAFLSDYTNITVSGSVNTNLTLIGDYDWQIPPASNMPISRPQFRFNGFNVLGSTNWGESDQVYSNYP